jgi:hypothetical protein
MERPQELEQVAQMRRQRLVAIGARPGFELAKECDDIVRRDRVRVAQLVAEPKGQESLHVVPAVFDRRLGQPALVAQVGFVLVTQAIQRG